MCADIRKGGRFLPRHRHTHEDPMAITVDLHNHTLHSHAKDTTEAMAASAFAKGMAIFGLSEHSLRPEGYMYPADYQPRLEAGFPSYIEEVLAEREKYQGRMEVLLALEMDYMPAETAYAAESVAQYPYEYIIGGLHFLDHWGFDHSASDWDPLTDAQCCRHFERYYEDLITMADTGLFQLAAHPDLVKLFRKGAFDAWVTTPKAREVINAALKAMRDNGMAMEISSAAIRKGLGEPYPGPVIMEMARDARVPISFGSDAHAVADVASNFEILAAYAQRFGYSESAVFRNRTMSLRPFV